jgi:protein TonB
VNIFSDNLDEILFQNRNKIYGAYLLRKKYHKQLLLSFLIIISVFSTIALIVFLLINQPEPEIKESPFFSEFMPQPQTNQIQPPEELLPELKKLEKKAAYVVPKIVNSDDDLTSNDLNVDQERSDTTNLGTSNNGSSNGVLDGSGTDDNAIYTYVQELPAFPGGEQALKSFIQRNMIYPKLAQQNKIQGRVYVSFVVEKNGSLTDIKVVQGIGAGCDDEALRVVRLMPKWKPGRRQGHEVRCYISMPLNFVFQSKS